MDETRTTRPDRRADQAPRSDQPSLPFDDEHERPIAYSLTARARRAVAPDALPSLAVVSPPARTAPSTPTTRHRERTAPDGPPAPGAPGTVGARGGDPDGSAAEAATDTRPARARAMRRSGLRPARIATTLGVDELVVRAWVGEKVPPLAVSGPVSSADGGCVAVGAGPVAHSSHSAGGVPAGPERLAAPASAESLLEQVRADARTDARVRLTTDPDFAAGVGLLAGLADVDAHAVTVTTQRPEVAARILDWLTTHAPVRRPSARLVLRLGPLVAGDVARHRWAERTGLPLDHVVPTRWRGGPAPDVEEALVRVPDEDLAATVAGWCDALLDPAGDDDPDGRF